jgi:outer membrane immunogenic protein
MMKRIVLAAASALALSAALPAAAADLPPRTPYGAPAYVQQQPTWTGFYLGLNAGGGWGSSDWAGMGINNSPSGGMVGITAGYNWQGFNNPWVFGIEADIDWAGFSGSTICQFGTNCETRSDWLGTARGRVGYSWAQPNSWSLIMPYITGGLAFGNIEANQSGFGSVSDTNIGWTVGTGLEVAFNRSWSAKVEYLYADMGDTNCGVPVCSRPTSVDLRMNILRGGLNYRF